MHGSGGTTPREPSDDFKDSQFIELRYAERRDKVSDEFIDTLRQIGAHQSLLDAMTAEPPHHALNEARLAWRDVARAREHRAGWWQMVRAIFRAFLATVRALAGRSGV